MKFKIPFLFFHSNSKFPSLPLKHQRSNTTVLSLLQTPTTPLSLTNTTTILSFSHLSLERISDSVQFLSQMQTDRYISLSPPRWLCNQPWLLRALCLPNTLTVSNIDEGVFKEDLHLLFLAFGRLEWIKFQTSTFALVKFINFYHCE